MTGKWGQKKVDMSTVKDIIDEIQRSQCGTWHDNEGKTAEQGTNHDGQRKLMKTSQGTSYT